MYIRTVKITSSDGTVHEYVRLVEAYRHGGKVKQRTITNLGRKDVLLDLLPQLQRVLKGTPAVADQPDDIDVLEALTWGPVLLVRHLFEQLGLWQLFDELLGSSAKFGPYADRAFVLVANRLICPKSEHGLARWLDKDFVCDRQGRRFVPHWLRRGRVQVHHQQLKAWYRTLDRLVRAKSQIEVRLYYRLRDLFSLQPDLVFYDITSTYFEGTGPDGLAKHGYSRDGKSKNVQIIVGLVMVAGWPIAHHVWEGNRVDSTTVQEVVKDLMDRFSFSRVIFVGDRGMVSEDNLDGLRDDGHGYLIGCKRRRNTEVDGWLQQVQESAWVDCPVGINAQEKATPPRTRVQEVAQDDPDRRVYVIDSEQRREYEQARREQAMERTQEKLQSVQHRVAQGKLTRPEAIGAAAERALRAHKGYRYYDWRIHEGAFEFFEHPEHLPREKRLEGRYVLATSEQRMDMVEAVQRYKELMEVERGFRHLKDVLALRPVYHQTPERTKGHVFVAALALLLGRLLERRLREAGLTMSAEQALEAVETIRQVTFGWEGETRQGVSAASGRAQQVVRALGLRQLRPPEPPAGEETRM
jgi:transposase